MAITIHCDNCGKQTRVADELAGKRVRCPGCKEPVTVTDRAARSQVTPPKSSPKPVHRPFASVAEEPDDDPTSELANPTYSTYTMDDSTRASNPGRIRVNILKFWTCYPFWPTLWLAGTVLFATLIPLTGIAITGVVVFGCFLILYWIRAREHFVHGCALPAIVLNPAQGLIAVSTDLSTGEGEYPAVKIMQQPLSRMTGGLPKKGQRLVAVAVYEQDPNQTDYWANFHPKLVACVTTNTKAIEESRQTISEDDYQELEQMLTQVKSRQPGLYRLWEQ